MDLVSFVVQPTWKEVLLELVSTEQMDPWDVDVGVVAQKYIEHLKSLQALDLRIPANVILAASLLLRFKSENLMVQEEDGPDTFEETVLQDEALPELVFRINRPRRRRVTLDELMKSMEAVMRKGRKTPSPRKAFLPAMLVHVDEEDMDQKMNAAFEKVQSKKDGEGMVLFSDLLEEKTPEHIAKQLLPVLHLVQEQKVNAWQDEFFGEIFIQVIESEAQPVAENS